MNDFEYMQRVHAMEQRLFHIAQAMLWRYQDCADAVQEAVFRGWMRRGSLREKAYFETWLIRILINVCKDVLRKRGREGTALLQEGSMEDGMCENLHLRLALKRLPEKYRLPLLLHYMEGYPVEDVAGMLGIAPSKVYSRLRQARKALRTLMEGGVEHE